MWQLNQTLGMKTLDKHYMQGIKGAVCGYDIWCPKHKFRSATWTVDEPTLKEIRYTFTRMYDEVSFPQHINCGTITIINETVQYSGLS